jgi:hypothetical protein
MITLEALRSALLADRPFTEIDRLVRGELGAGRTTAQVFDNLQSWVDEAVQFPGLTEDGEEALLGALDALTGNCHRDCQYHDPPRPAAPVVPASPDRLPEPRG